MRLKFQTDMFVVGKKINKVSKSPKSPIQEKNVTQYILRSTVLNTVLYQFHIFSEKTENLFVH